jgi:hypothetical protein
LKTIASLTSIPRCAPCFFQRLLQISEANGQWVSFHPFSRRVCSLALIAALNLSLAQDFSEGLVASGAVEEAYC